MIKENILIEPITIITIICVTIIILYIITTVEVISYIKNKKRNEIISNEDKKITNDLYRLYLDVNPKDCREKIDDLIDFYMTEYVIYHFDQNDLYIRSDQTEEMIKAITETTYINLSDLYVFYMKMIINIKSEEDILGYINNRVKTRTLLYISEVNKTNK